MQKNKFYYAILLGTELGFLISLPLVSFLLLGFFLDKKFNTSPAFLIGGTILGIIFSIADFYYFLLPFFKKGQK